MEKTEELDVENNETSINEGLMITILEMSKGILEHKAHMKWEVLKEYEEISVDDVIKHAYKLLSFVQQEKK